MTDEKEVESSTAPPADQPSGGTAQPGSPLLRLPGLIAISLYMLLLAGTVILGVASRHFPPLYLFFPALFLAAGFGLLLLLRWAWALALGAVTLLMGLFLYQFTTQHAPSALLQGLLNLVFFLYLIRTEVRASLR